MAQWADVYYVDWIDNNLNYLWKIYNGAEGVSRTPDWDNNKKPRIVCRLIDWDLWNAYVPFYEKAYMDFIDQAICIAPHMEAYIRSKADYGDKLKLIRPGVNLDTFTIKETVTDGFQLGMVLGDMWWPKNHMGGLDIFTTLYRKNPKWRLHIRGQHEGGTEYWKVMFDHYLESRGITDKVTLYPHTEDMNAWLEQIDVLLHPGMKEAYCYAVAEAMAKGIPAVVNEFYGSRDIWKKDMLYQTHSQAVQIIEDLQLFNTDLLGNRKYMEKNHSLETMLKEMDEYLGL